MGTAVDVNIALEQGRVAVGVLEDRVDAGLAVRRRWAWSPSGGAVDLLERVALLEHLHCEVDKSWPAHMRADTKTGKGARGEVERIEKSGMWR